MLLRTSRPDANNKTCIEYVGLRAKALPLHRPMEFQQEWRNLSTNATGKFIQEPFISKNLNFPAKKRCAFFAI